MKRDLIRALLPLLLFIGLGGFFALGLMKDPRILPSEMIDRPMPEFSLSSLFDETEVITRADLLGEVRLINIFGSWCASCVIEHPILEEISRQNILPIIGVDWRDERDKGQAWLARYGNPYDRVIFDKDSVLAIRMGVSGAPESFLVDKKGNIRYKVTGVITTQIWNESLMPLITVLKAE